MRLCESSRGENDLEAHGLDRAALTIWQSERVKNKPRTIPEQSKSFRTQCVQIQKTTLAKTPKKYNTLESSECTS